MKHVLLALVLAWVGPARADEAPPVDCQNHDQRPDLKPAQLVSCRHPDHARIRAAVGRYCAKATGEQGKRCTQIKPLVQRCVCQIELHHVGDDGKGTPELPYAWLGGDPAANDLFWGVELARTKRWIVTSVFFDDYERP